MGEALFHASSDVIGILGALRHCRALTASFVGKYVKKSRHTQFQLYRLRNDSACMGPAFFCGNNYAGIITGVILIEHRHAMYPTQQPDQYFRHLPVCLQSGKYDFHDHLLHRRLFGYLPWKQLADLGMEWRGRHRRYFNNNIVVHHPLQQEIKGYYHFPSKRKDLIILFVMQRIRKILNRIVIPLSHQTINDRLIIDSSTKHSQNNPMNSAKKIPSPLVSLFPIAFLS